MNLTNRITYILQDSTGRPIKGRFYQIELLITTKPDIYLVERVLRKMGNKRLVKWLGFPNDQNSWIDKSYCELVVVKI